MEDIFESALEIFGSGQVAFGQPGSFYYHTRPNGEQVILRVTPIEAEKCDLQAQYVWRSAFVMSDLIEKGIIKVKNKMILELGAGSGLPSIIAIKNQAKKICISDYPTPQTLTTMKENVNLANVNEHAYVRGYKWGEDVSSLNIIPDIVLLSDLLWMSTQHAALLTTLKDLSLLSSSSDMTMVIVSGLHSGWNAIERFLRTASLDYGFSWRRVHIHSGQRTVWYNGSESSSSEIRNVFADVVSDESIGHGHVIVCIEIQYRG